MVKYTQINKINRMFIIINLDERLMFYSTNYIQFYKNILSNINYINFKKL